MDGVGSRLQWYEVDYRESKNHIWTFVHDVGMYNDGRITFQNDAEAILAGYQVKYGNDNARLILVEKTWIKPLFLDRKSVG